MTERAHRRAESTRVPGHAFGGFGQGTDEYDPFNPLGPWLARCQCGATGRRMTKDAGRRWHRAHKLREKAARIDDAVARAETVAQTIRDAVATQTRAAMSTDGEGPNDGG